MDNKAGGLGAPNKWAEQSHKIWQGNFITGVPKRYKKSVRDSAHHVPPVTELSLFGGVTRLCTTECNPSNENVRPALVLRLFYVKGFQEILPLNTQPRNLTLVLETLRSRIWVSGFIKVIRVINTSHLETRWLLIMLGLHFPGILGHFVTIFSITST